MNFYKVLGRLVGCLLVITMVLGVLALSWITTCGIVWLVMWCFGWAFSWPIATGVWIIWWCLGGILRAASGK